MKHFYKILIVFTGLSLMGLNSFSQEFFHKKDINTNRMRSSSDYRKTVKIADLFDYPSEIDLKSEISKNPDISINFSSTNNSRLLFDGYYYSKWSGQYFYYNVPANIYGKDTLTVTISYNGKIAVSKLVINTDPIRCKNDSYHLAMGDTLEVILTKNDIPQKFFDYSTFEIIKNSVFGKVHKLRDGTIQYISSKDASNYSIDTLIYRIADINSNYDTAMVLMNLHKDSYVTKVFDFLPAPGQFVNTSWADTAAGKKVIGNTGGGVSLGGFGGYIIVGFDQPIVNRNENPYGVDITVVGNAFYGWGEPAAVKVMKDENGNGLPDDTWYELAGSEYHFSSSIKNLTMAYYNPKYNERHTIPYSTDKGFNGAMRTNGFHKQQYYPDPASFGINADSVNYKGTFTKFLLDKSDPSLIKARRIPLFGYADAHPNGSDPTKPQNPYTKDENGKQTDGFDLEWAVDMSGNHVEIDTVHFVKIYNTVQEDGGWLGEVSSEIFKVAITTPDPDYVAKDYEAHAIGASQLQVLKGETLQLEGILFKNGIPQSGTQSWTSRNTNIATINNSGLLTAVENGKTTVHFSVKGDVTPDSLEIDVVELTGVVIELEGNSSVSNDTIRVIKGETEYIHAEAIDNRKAPANRFVYETFNWSSSDNSVGTINKGIFKAKAEGTTIIIAESVHKPVLKDTIIAVVTSIPEVVAVNDTILLPYYNKTGSLTNKELFSTGVNAIVSMKSKRSSSSIINSSIKNNIFKYNVLENKYGIETIEFTVEAFGKESKVNIVFQAIEPDNFSTPKQILFTNGGEFMNPGAPTELMSYIPVQDTTIQIDGYLAGATSVQDMLVDGNFAFVSADYYITRYNISNRTATDSIYTQDVSPTEADGTGEDMAGVNHKLAVYRNMLLATRQNSAKPPQDGYNVRVYNKGDLSFITKIPVSNQATDVVIVNDTAYVMINGGFAGKSSSMAIIDMNTLSLKREVDLGTAGLGVMQMIVKENKIYCVRLADAMGKYNSGVVIYNITTSAISEIEYTSGIPYDSSPLAIEPATNDTLFIKKDLGYTVFNTQTNTFGEDTYFNIPLRYTQDKDHIGRGSAYDPEEGKYYVAYAYWHGAGVGQIYNSNMDSIGIFKGVGASPEVMKICAASPDNEKPYINSHYHKTYNEGQDINFSISSYTFKDNEDSKAAAYMYNPLQYEWLAYNPSTRVFTGKYKNEILEASTFEIIIQGIDKQGAFALDTVKITINPVDDPMILEELIPDITVEEDASDSLIILTKTFVDVDNAIQTRVLSNSNTTLINTSINNNILTLAFNENQNGKAEITIEAESNGLMLTDTFNVTVNPIDDAPVVANPIEDITVDEDELIKPVHISTVFNDIDNDNNAISISIKNVSNPELLTAKIKNDSISITLADNKFGISEIVVEANSNNLMVTDTFIVTVNALNDSPVVMSKIEDVVVDMNAADKQIDLSNLFEDVDGDKLEITVSKNTNKSLVQTSISANTLTLSFTANQYGNADITLMADDGKENVTTSFKVTVNNTTGVYTPENMAINIYPNPVKEIATIECEFGMKQIIIYNSIGNIQKLIKLKNNKICKINLSGLPAGTYFMSIKGNNKKTTRKLIKQ